MTTQIIPVIRLAGKARQVFREIELAARYRGSVTLKELAEPPVREFDFDEWTRLNEKKESEDEQA